jgi:hypothetical protein
MNLWNYLLKSVYEWSHDVTELYTQKATIVNCDDWGETNTAAATPMLPTVSCFNPGVL